jgi:hypothetical protein
MRSLPEGCSFPVSRLRCGRVQRLSGRGRVFHRRSRKAASCRVMRPSDAVLECPRKPLKLPTLAGNMSSQCRRRNNSARHETILGFWRRTPETPDGYQAAAKMAPGVTGINRRQSNADHKPDPGLRFRGGRFFGGWFRRNGSAGHRHLLVQWVAGGHTPRHYRCRALTARLKQSQ